MVPRRKMLRTISESMGREAPVRLEHARSWEAAASFLPQFMHAHVARFLVTGRISNVAHPERRVFLEELTKLLSESGWLLLTRMMAGEKAFAWNYGFQFSGHMVLVPTHIRQWTWKNILQGFVCWPS